MSSADGLQSKGARLHPLDAAAQVWMRMTSRRVAADEVRWLHGPSAGTRVVAHEWVQAAASRMGGRTTRGPEHGLIPRFGDLAGTKFDPSEVNPQVVDFYERTASYRMDLWSEWSPIALPFGRLISAFWSRRLQQLSLPTRPLDVSFGMDSEVVHILDDADAHRASAWLRTMRKTGDTTYSGQYGIETLPGATQPSVRVVFPLPRGCLPVFLTPTAGKDGSLHLRSPIGAFGSDGAYLVLEEDSHTLYVRRIPIAEHFHVYIDADGVLRTDHSLKLRSVPALRLHYRMTKAA